MTVNFSCEDSDERLTPEILSIIFLFTEESRMNFVGSKSSMQDVYDEGNPNNNAIKRTSLVHPTSITSIPPKHAQKTDLPE